MIVTSHTRVSELIKANSACIDAIAALAKPLRKLKNPLLRRVMAPRVTIAQAAAMGGCSVADFRKALEPLGFTFADDDTGSTGSRADGQQRPEWLGLIREDRMEYFDVRALIESGDDPLKAILHRYQALRQGHALCIINSFIPYPLIHLLEKKGSQSFIETADDGVYYTWFLSNGEKGKNAAAKGQVTMHDADSFSRMMDVYGEAILRRIDVRHLPMPLPMETILEALPALVAEDILYIQHKRVPLHLLEALEGEPYTIHIHEAGEGDVRMMIIRNATA